MRSSGKHEKLNRKSIVLRTFLVYFTLAVQLYAFLTECNFDTLRVFF